MLQGVPAFRIPADPARIAIVEMGHLATVPVWHRRGDEVRRTVLNLIALLASMVMATTAQAKWFEATSKHFVVYSDRGTEQSRIMATKLERFDAALRQLTSRPDDGTSPSARVTIFMVQSPLDVSRLFGKGGSYVGGFYASIAGASYAIVPPFLVQETGENNDSEGILLHEYAHHFVSENQSVLYPIWLNEGFAEFVSTARFEKNGSIGLGLVGEWRGWQLNHQVTVPVELLVDSQAYFNRREVAFDTFYPRSWLLYHMLTFEPSREGQLVAYAGALSRGLNDRDAAIAAFGDLRKLELDLQAYGRKVSMPYYLIKGETLPPVSVSVRELSSGASEIIPLWMRMRRGIEDKLAEGVAAEARAIGARNPQDPFVQTVLAKAEFDADHFDAALVASESALAADPRAIEAQVLKGRSLLGKANEGTATSADWNAVRAAFLKANALDADHPLPLFYYYLSYLNQGFKPTGNALQALHRSLELAPYDRGLREEVALSQIDRAQFDEAKATLRMLMRDPHLPIGAARIRAAVEKLDERNAVAARKLLQMTNDEFEQRGKEGPADTGEGRTAES